MASCNLPIYAITAVKDVIVKEGFTDYNIKYLKGSNIGDGFATEIYRIEVTGTRSTKNKDKLYMIAKLPSEKPTIKNLYGLTLFEREILTYNDILTAMVKFQNKYHIHSNENGFFAFPKCYLTYINKEQHHGLILMEDLRQRDFKLNIKKMESLDFEHCALFLEKLAQFHGTSLLMKNMCPEEFRQFQTLKNTMVEVIDCTLTLPAAKIHIEMALHTLDYPNDEIYIEKVQNVYENILINAFEFTDILKAEPYAVISHGDCWINNILFRYDELNRPTEICLFDWQGTHYASPALDFVNFIFICTDKSMRDKYYDEFINIYYKSLNIYIGRFGKNAVDLFPFNNFINHLKMFGHYALFGAVFEIPLLSSEEILLPIIRNIIDEIHAGHKKPNELYKFFSENKQSCKNIFKERMSDVFRDLVKLEYL